MRPLSADPGHYGFSAEGARRKQRRLQGNASRQAARVFGKLAVVFCAGALLAISFGLYQSGWLTHKLNRFQERLLLLSAGVGLGLQDIALEGRLRTDPTLIAEIIGLNRSDPILALSPTLLQERLEALEWVKSAEVQRYFPGTLYVKLAERYPTALWEKDGQLWVIDQEGEIIESANPTDFRDMIIIAGEDAPRHANELMKLIVSHKEIGSLVRTAVRVGERRWNLRLVGDIDVQLPEDNPAKAFLALGNFLAKHPLYDKDVTVIDLRLPDRLILRSSARSQLLPHDREDGEDI